MPSKEVAIKNSAVLASFLLVVWGFYRLLFQLPEEVEEFFVKPVIWLVPTFFLLWRERSGLASVGITLKNLFPAIYFALTLGTLFVLEAMIINYLKYSKFDFGSFIGGKPLLISFVITFATAVSEEVSFRGFLFNRVWFATGREWAANLVTSIIWAVIHVPVTVFVWKFDLFSSLVYLFLVTLFGIGSAWVFARTKNVTSSIFLHVLWQWPIILFR
ncbi:MAG: hypothetical protein ACD_57C00309G0001 [uncultured bacterium]|uniref:CAAX prenyl protease 2/Lysostaphin resistance protein A-like domain-containing protein n=1 Tax=Candidatus Woesebacteria bacterium RIFCSPHIGHO2_12_FULL_41_24 TaxID=1802510 RepID=A0A1F8ATF5_9BACT|nr:MAG: hypothetical protein ACD_57C00309G0001 [uncultured bacterium]OGM14580.1 MAG: hypothetical protein A2W15_01300 [Candidatus Woesebacteria bacterium RBG_16_41_13]OGM30406.1 MAG: hypothetical protein A2873_00425 [Candidatus Woesebacteria bacterium RIFCSPHIGHO2_01_FULL_42_80]OGM35452.1 MAG: hypothetical protein A3D84_05740 [Candidatus Woesebacteria bacterium RIFCSPHIGHO2_02_FULL_42_20]OGM55027.1 MAG: hypothetical protein A3E44_04725 [Candidatus Woesebacteria bacterium RIFCSPHIGHO2_12_FULL_41